MRNINKYLFLLVLLFPLTGFASSPAVYTYTVKRSINAVYPDLRKALESEGYYVILEPNIGKNISRFAEDWGDDYNRNKLDGIRSMVFCNGWYANKVSNADPDMLAMCPLHLTLIEKNGKTTALFVRPSVVAKGSPAEKIMKSIETEVTGIIQESLGM